MLTPPPPHVPTEADLIPIARAFNSARNAHDVEGTLAFFATSARVHLGETELTDRNALRAWLGGLYSHGFHVHTGQYAVQASTVRWDAEVGIDPFASLGIRARGIAEATMDAGHIVSFVPVMENSAEWRREAAAAAQQRAHTIRAAPTPMAGDATGTAPGKPAPSSPEARSFGAGARLPVYLSFASVATYMVISKRCRG